MALLSGSGWVHSLAGAVVVSVALAACGGPVLQNAPRPNPAIVAGAAAATAAAITLADPDGAARNVNAEHEMHRPVERVQPTSGETAPADVLDRLDDAERQAHAPPQPGATPPSASPAQPARANPTNPAKPASPAAVPGPATAPSPFFPTPDARPPTP
jgi:hypothetical protein